jgi:hypothetical protein
MTSDFYFAIFFIGSVVWIGGLLGAWRKSAGKGLEK